MWGHADAELGDLEHQLSCLLENVNVLYQDAAAASHWKMEARSVANSLSYLLSLTKANRRRIQVRKERTNMLIQILFYRAARQDALNSLKISHSTQTIAFEAQQDGTAMITYVLSFFSLSDIWFRDI
jgi:hypothetical protein